MYLMAEQIYKFNHSEYLFKHSAVLKSFIALRNILWFLSLNFEGCFNFKLRWLQVDTVEGLRDLQIPSGIQPGDSVKLSCLGVPDINKPSVRGDHYFIVNVLIPKDIRSVFFLPSFLISLKKEFIIDFLFSVLPVPKVWVFVLWLWFPRAAFFSKYFIYSSIKGNSCYCPLYDFTVNW